MAEVAHLPDFFALSLCDVGGRPLPARFEREVAPCPCWSPRSNFARLPGLGGTCAAKLSPEQDASDQATEIARRYGKIIKSLPGHVSTVMFQDGQTLYSITTWDTEEHAEAVQSVRDDAQRDLGNLLTGAPSSAIVETIVHDVS